MKQIDIPKSELEFRFIASPGPGGQNVNKVASGVLLRFNVIQSSALSEEVKERLLKLKKAHITQSGDLLIKATKYRTQLRNKEDAIARLHALIHSAQFVPKKRKPTKPTKAAKKKRLDSKKKHSEKKAGRAVRPLNH